MRKVILLLPVFLFSAWNVSHAKTVYSENFISKSPVIIAGSSSVDRLTTTEKSGNKKGMC